MEWSGIRKFADIAAQVPDALSLCVGEPDFKTPERVRRAAMKSLEEGKTRYSMNMGLPELRAAIAHYMERRFRLKYDPNVVVFCDANGKTKGAMNRPVTPSASTIRRA